MASVKLELGATIDTATKDEIRDVLDKRDAARRRSAIGFKVMDFPLMSGTISAGAITLGGDQPDQIVCGPTQGFAWAVHRISVLGLATNDTLQLYKGSNRFVCTIAATVGAVFFGKGQLSLMPGDFLRLVGSSLSATGQIKVYSEGFNVPAPMIAEFFK